MSDFFGFVPKQQVKNDNFKYLEEHLGICKGILILGVQRFVILWVL